MKTVVKRHIVSVVVSFVGGAGAYLLAAFDSMATFQANALKAALIGAGFAGAREVVKVLVEWANHVRKPKSATPVA